MPGASTSLASTDQPTGPTRHCRGCDHTLPLELFRRDRSKPLGREYTCARCRSEAARKHIGRTWLRRFLVRRQKYGLASPCTYFTEAELVAHWGDRCYKCAGAGEILDHVVPVRAGGHHSLDNCRLICWKCSWAKGKADRAMIRRFDDERGSCP